MNLLSERGAAVDYHDPHIAHTPSMRSWPDLAPRSSVALTADAVASYDCVLICTDHDVVDYELVIEHAKLIIDTRGVYRGARPNVVKA